MSNKRRVDVSLRLSRFRLPPVESALIVGKSAVIGSNAMHKALNEMLPGEFVLVRVEHPTAEAVIVRKAHLRRVPEEKLVELLLRHAEGVMDASEMIHADVEIELSVSESLEV